MFDEVGCVPQFSRNMNWYLAPTITTNLLQAAAKKAVATKIDGPHLGFGALPYLRRCCHLD